MQAPIIKLSEFSTAVIKLHWKFRTESINKVSLLAKEKTLELLKLLNTQAFTML